jgi:hypothetical protein
MMSPGTFKVYALRCRDGRVERHSLDRRSRLDLALMEADRKDVTSSRCGPHTVVEATVTMTEWQPAQDPLGEVEVAEKSAGQIKAEAEQRPCTKCGVQPGQPCENLTARRAGVQVPTTWPHAERFDG